MTGRTTGAKEKNMFSLRKIAQNADLMGEMIHQKNVKIPNGIDSSVEQEFRSAIFNCITCDSVGTCQEHLKEDSEEQDVPEFCPNSSLFNRWRDFT